MKENLDSTCPRIGDFYNYYSNLDKETIVKQDGAFGNSLHIRAAEVICKTAALKDGTGRPKTIERLTAEVVVQDSKDALATRQASHFPEAAKNLRNATQDLSNLIR